MLDCYETGLHVFFVSPRGSRELITYEEQRIREGGSITHAFGNFNDFAAHKVVPSSTLELVQSWWAFEWKLNRWESGIEH